ncbi:hypothetical protein V2J09_008797 [Rumex salicifolius]
MDPFLLNYQMENFHHFNHTIITHLSTNNNNNQESNLPPGFRFHPTDEELITFYLLKKVLDSSFNGRAIAEVDLNKSEPWELPEKAKMGEKEWYFFSLRDRKYPTGLRTNRATEAGYWKATGKDREIYSSKTCSLVGMKKTLVFYRGRAPRGEKTNWVMHEYRLEGKFAYHYLSRSSKDEWVISRIFQKSGTGSGSVSGSGSSAVSGGKKGRVAHGGPAGGGINLYPDVGSPASVSLPPLLDSSPYKPSSSSAASGSAYSYNTGEVAAAVNRMNRSEHVSCFSNAVGLAPSPAGALPFDVGPHLQAEAAAAARPGNPMRSVDESLQLSGFHFPGGPAGVLPENLIGGWGGEPEELKLVVDCGGGGGGRVGGFSELDCMWGF